jgi:hypothetical protein
MRIKQILIIVALIIIVTAVFLYYPYLQCQSIQDSYKDYVGLFIKAPCTTDEDCISTGYKVGLCSFCVGDDIDLKKVDEFNSQFTANRCNDKGFSAGCLAVVRYCKCIENICQFSNTM